MKKVGVTIGGKRYTAKLDDAFADFVMQDLEEAGINFMADNKPHILFKAYLRIAMQMSQCEEEIAKLTEMIENSIDLSLDKE